MTTLEEISSDELANWEFWTAHASFALACYRQTRCPLERSSFRSNMRNRRTQTYYERGGSND
jgi:hypothetical protein